ncbi:MAG: clostripain-related cysteine peptidase [bacterium]
MKKFIIPLIIILPLMLSSTINVSVYMAADNSMVFAVEDNISDMIRASENNSDILFNIMQDTGGSSYRLRIRNGSIDTLMVSGNINSGDANTVSEFFIESFNYSKADKYIAVLWNHGNGWYESKSILYDNNPNDFISVVNGELREIFSRINNALGRRLDIALFDACAMQSLEVLYEIRDYAEYSAGSSVRVPYYGMPYDKIFSHVNSDMSNRDIGQVICDSSYSHYSQQLDSIDFSLVYLPAVNSIAQSAAGLNPLSLLRINRMECSIPDSILSGDVYQQTDKDYLSGMKMHFPADISSFIALYRDYIHLSLDREYDITRQLFPYYGVPDTFPPLRIDSVSIIDRGHSNYSALFNEPYDFSPIEKYEIALSKTNNTYNYSFEDTFRVFSGEYFYDSENLVSKPYSLRVISISDTFITEGRGVLIDMLITGDSDDTLTLSTDSDTLFISDFNKYQWDRYRLILEGNSPVISFSTDSLHYINIDNLRVAGLDSMFTGEIYEEDYLFHKLDRGNYCLTVKPFDIYSNAAVSDSIFEFEISTPVETYAYPNPAGSKVNIVAGLSGDYQLRVFTAAGALALTVNGQSETGIIELKGLELKPGLYFYTVETQSRLIRGKFSII